MRGKAIVGAFLIVVLCVMGPSRAFGADEPAAIKPVQVKDISGVLTLWSLGHEPQPNAPHTYVITHGLGGIQDRFFDLGNAIAASDPRANVLIVDWSPGAVRNFGPFSNPWAAADQIDPTGDALAALLLGLNQQHLFNSAEASFIGESFGNYVNNRAAESIRKADAGQVKHGLLLNPASEAGGYRPPLVKANYSRSVSFVSPSPFDTRQEIADRLVHLKTASADPFVQHTFGVRWLRERTQAGDAIASHFRP